MIRIRLGAVGKVKEGYFREAFLEYEKRLGRFCRLSVTEIKEELLGKDGAAERAAVVRREGERILPELRGRVAALAVEGKKLSSEGLSAWMTEAVSRGAGELTFVIGGSYGLSDAVKGRADLLLSFSDMTFPHTLTRVLLAEQLYRAFTIAEGSGYHK